MNHERITHRFSFLHGACVVCAIRRWTVSDCKWIRVEGGLCMILSFERLKTLCVLFMTRSAQFMRRVCVTVRGTRVGHRAYVSELVRNRTRPRPSTDVPPS